MDASAADAMVTPPAEVEEAARPTIKVAVAGSEPFVIPSEGGASGFSVGVWEAVAQQMGLDYEYIRFGTVALAAVKSGKARLAIGPISITSERARDVDFTQPYYNAELGILTSSRPKSAWDAAKPFISRAFLLGAGGLLAILLLVGNLIWLAERRVNSEQFPKRYASGVGNGMWFALVTATTVGYGDRAPRSTAGRVITSMWMLIAVFAASSVTAGIATGLTLSQLEQPPLSQLSALARHRVVAVEGTPGELIARRNRVRLSLVQTKEEALALVEQGSVDAFLYDYPVLRYYLDQNPKIELAVYGAGKNTDNYGFATAHGDSLNDQVDLALLRLRETRVISDLESTWLSPL
jgi:polar amino acid transport system substrate-binding protein